MPQKVPRRWACWPGAGNQTQRAEMSFSLPRVGRWRYLPLYITLFPEIQWKVSAIESCRIHMRHSAPVPGLPPHPSFAASQVGIFMWLWPSWTCLLPCLFWNWDHRFHSGICSLENERVKKALKTKIPPSLRGRESTRDHEIPGERLQIQQFLWARRSSFQSNPNKSWSDLCLTFSQCALTGISNVQEMWREKLAWKPKGHLTLLTPAGISCPRA